MNKSRILAAVILSSVIFGGPVVAAKTKMHAMASSIKCPSCGMPMPNHKTAMMTVPVKVGKSTYYCCAQCPSGQKAAKAAGMKSSKSTM
jgi:hypothetical protein